MFQKLKIIGIVVLSAGWLIPAYVCLWTLTAWLDTDVADHLHHIDPQYTTQFTLQIQQWFQISFVWFSAALLFWASIAAIKLVRK
jgi:hypothetical protein